MKQFFDDLFKGKYIYAYIPIALCALANFAIYFLTLLYSDKSKAIDLTTSFDDKIPLVTPMIVVYVFAYAFWIAGYCIIGSESREMCYKICMGDLIAKFICLLFFVFMPTTMQTPEIAGNSIFDNFTRFIYDCDKPYNLFPSIHCLESYVCFFGAVRAKKCPKWYKIASFWIMILIFASVVMVKQHILVDIPAGVAVAVIGFVIAEKTGIYKVFYKLEKLYDK